MTCDRTREDTTWDQCTVAPQMLINISVYIMRKTVFDYNCTDMIWDPLRATPHGTSAQWRRNVNFPVFLHTSSRLHPSIGDSIPLLWSKRHWEITGLGRPIRASQDVRTYHLKSPTSIITLSPLREAASWTTWPPTVKFQSMNNPIKRNKLDSWCVCNIIWKWRNEIICSGESSIRDDWKLA